MSVAISPRRLCRPGAAGSQRALPNFSFGRMVYWASYKRYHL